MSKRIVEVRNDADDKPNPPDIWPTRLWLLQNVPIAAVACAAALGYLDFVSALVASIATGLWCAGQTVRDDAEGR